MATKSVELDMAKIESEASKAEQACAAYVRCSVSWRWPGQQRNVRGELREGVVGLLEARGEAVSASTRMWDWRNPALARIGALKREAIAFWQRCTVAWPDEAGTRLLPKAKVDEFETFMRAARAELRQLASEVQAVRDEVIEQARRQRGRAFREADYPPDLSTLFGLSWGYSSLQVSEELKEISANAYSAEKVRQTARMLGALRMAEEQSVRELHELAGRLASRLEAVDAEVPQGEARLPIFASMVEAVQEFAGRFSEVVCWGCDDLDEVVREAGGAVEGVGADDLKADKELRGRVAASLASVASRLALIVPELASVQFPATGPARKAAGKAQVALAG